MKAIIKSTRFKKDYKKDYKKYKNDPSKIQALFDIVGYLERGEAIPAKYKPHFLKGEYKGCLECHIQNDLLLIWIDLNNETIILERLGSHSELFKK